MKNILEYSSFVHPHDKVKSFLKSLIGAFLEFGFFIVSLIWTLGFLIFRFDSTIFFCVLLLLISLSLWFFYIVFIKYYLIKVNRYSIKIQNLKNPVRFIFISDMHIGKERIGSNKRRIKIIVDKINDLKPELVVFGGDFVCNKYYIELLNELKNIKSKHKIGVYGNHDSLYLLDKQQSEFPTKGNEILKSLEINILNNQGIKLIINDQELFFGGITDMASLNSDIAQAFQNSQKDDIKILISHNPDIVDFVEEKDNLDLILSGHTHAGQILLPFIGPLLPMPVRNRWLTRGLFRLKNKAQLFISQGVGYTGTKVRLGTECEICEIVLSNKL